MTITHDITALMRRADLETRADAITRRRVEIAGRVGLAAVAPAAVSDDELRALRDERRELEVVLEHVLSQLSELERARRTNTKVRR